MAGEQDLYALTQDQVERLRRLFEDWAGTRLKQIADVPRKDAPKRIDTYVVYTTDIITVGEQTATELTTLNGSIGDSVASINVYDTSLFPVNQQFVITVDGEQMLVSAFVGSSVTVTRGYNGTAAAAHIAGVSVNLVVQTLGFGPAKLLPAIRNSSGDWIMQPTETAAVTIYNLGAEIDAETITEVLREPFSGLLIADPSCCGSSSTTPHNCEGCATSQTTMPSAICMTLTTGQIYSIKVTLLLNQAAYALNPCAAWYSVTGTADDTTNLHFGTWGVFNGAGVESYVPPAGTFGNVGAITDLVLVLGTCLTPSPQEALLFGPNFLTGIPGSVIVGDWGNFPTSFDPLALTGSSAESNDNTMSFVAGACSTGTTTSPPGIPVLNINTAPIAINAPTLKVTGKNFSETNTADAPTNLSLSATATTAASPAPTATTATWTFGTPPSGTGPLTANMAVTVGGVTVSTGLPVQVATVVAAPTVSVTTTSIGSNAKTFFATGTGFDPVASGNTVVISGVTATAHVIAATATAMTVQFDSGPTGTGDLKVVITSHGGSSGAAVKVASVSASAGPLASLSTAVMPAAQTKLVITGSGFNATPANNTLAFDNGAIGTAGAGSTTTVLLVTLSTPPTASGPLNVVVTDTGTSVTSGAPQQVAFVQAGPVITPSSTGHAIPLSTLAIAGTDLAVFSIAGLTGTTPIKIDLSSGTARIVSANGTTATIAFLTQPDVGALSAMITNAVGSSAWAEIANVQAGSAPTITVDVAEIAETAITLAIAGTGFDPTPPVDINNTIVFSNTGGAGAVGVVSSVNAGGTSMSVQVSFATTGRLDATVTRTADAVSSSATEVAVIVSAAVPTITQSTTTLVGPILTINGTGFSSTAANNTLVLSPAGTGTVIAATTTALTVNVTGAAQGVLSATVTVAGQTSTRVQVATVGSTLPPVVTPSTASVPVASTTLTIDGGNFDPTASNDSVVLSGTSSPSGGTVSVASASRLTVTGVSFSSNGTVLVVVTTGAGNSGSAVQVATATLGLTDTSTTTTIGNPPHVPGGGAVYVVDTSLYSVGMVLTVHCTRTSDGAQFYFVCSITSITGSTLLNVDISYIQPPGQPLDAVNNGAIIDY